ncbi:M14 family metallopeptidase [Bacteroidota bacterium]
MKNFAKTLRLLLIIVSLLSVRQVANSQIFNMPDELYSKAEKTNYEETSKHIDVMNFVQALVKHSDVARLEIIGKSFEGKEIPLVIMADPMVNSPEEAEKSGKVVIYLEANIHAGEVEGKEASIQLMREIAFGPKRRLLENQILLFCPNFNPDGNDKMKPGNRRSQEGSPIETGERYTGEGLDLNRDGLKAEGLETKAMLKNILNKYDPAMLIDLHTTNGTWHGYSLTYAPGAHTVGHHDITYYMRDSLFPVVTKKVKDRSGLDMYFYGGYRGFPPTTFSGAPSQPRFITNSVALKNRLSILVETFAHDRFERRILSNVVFLTSVLEYTDSHSREIIDLLQKVNNEIVDQVKEGAGTMQKGVNFKTVQLGEPVNILAYEMEEYTDDNGRTRQRSNGNKVLVKDVKLMQKSEPSKLATVPMAYVFPAELKNVAEKLIQHGVVVDILEKRKAFLGEEFTVSEFKQAEREYQNHLMASIKGEFNSKTKRIPAGSYYVDMAQPYAYLIFYLLEPEADDGLVVWNYFDDYLIKKGIEKKEVVFPVFKVYSQK